MTSDLNIYISQCPSVNSPLGNIAMVEHICVLNVMIRISFSRLVNYHLRVARSV